MIETREAASTESLFADFAPTAAEHYRLHFHGAVLVCLEHAAAASGSFDAMLERFPFLVGYNNDLAGRLEGLSPRKAFASWCSALEAWEGRVRGHLPLRAIRLLLGADATAVMCLLTPGLVEEDARFGDVFDFLQGGSHRRPGAGLLRQLWGPSLPPADFLRLSRRARNFGLLQPAGSDPSQPDQPLLIPAAMWEAMRGDDDVAPVAWARYREPQSLLAPGELLLPPDTRAAFDGLPALIERGEVRAVAVRGAGHSGRRTLLGALARSIGRGLLELSMPSKLEETPWNEVVALAQLRNAVPVAAFDLGPGETAALPEDWPPGIPLGLVLGRHGGLGGSLSTDTVVLNLEAPGPAARRLHWQRALGGSAGAGMTDIVSRHRIQAGHIHRAARLARTRAKLAARAEPQPGDVLEALRSVNRQTLDALAQRVPAEGDWSRLCVDAATFREIEQLERRCRHREAILGLASAPSPAVKVLACGPSGSGKTWFARLLAARLGKDLYQLDLSAVVNKYIGETEKNLGRIFDAAEELDVVLLLDEGDALLSQRTDVENSNDRHSNGLTNFLLQKLDSGHNGYQGILVVTTNARGRIDPAFERRMDVTVEFRLPEPEERWALWQLHLPAGHAVSESFLSEVAARCVLSGGQIRNASLQAALMALDQGGPVTTAVIEAAVRREYAKQGGTCPLRHVAEPN